MKDVDEMDDMEWIYRDVDDSFYEKSGLVEDEDKLKEMFSDIPSSFKFEASVLLGFLKRMVEMDCDMDCRDMQLRLFLCKKNMEEELDISLKIPHYWADVPVITPESIARITNGIIGFDPDESCDDCIRTDECWYYNNREIRNDGD